MVFVVINVVKNAGDMMARTLESHLDCTNFDRDSRDSKVVMTDRTAAAKNDATSRQRVVHRRRRVSCDDQVTVYPSLR